MRRVCLTERYSVMSRRLSAQVSTTWLPKLLTSLMASRREPRWRRRKVHGFGEM
jgi:hypothetical protein